MPSRMMGNSSPTRMNNNESMRNVRAVQNELLCTRALAVKRFGTCQPT